MGIFALGHVSHKRSRLTSDSAVIEKMACGALRPYISLVRTLHILNGLSAFAQSWIGIQVLECNPVSPHTLTASCIITLYHVFSFSLSFFRRTDPSSHHHRQASAVVVLLFSSVSMMKILSFFHVVFPTRPSISPRLLIPT